MTSSLPSSTGHSTISFLNAQPLHFHIKYLEKPELTEKCTGTAATKLSSQNFLFSSLPGTSQKHFPSLWLCPRFLRIKFHHPFSFFSAHFCPSDSSNSSLNANSFAKPQLPPSTYICSSNIDYLYILLQTGINYFLGMNFSLLSNFKLLKKRAVFFFSNPPQCLSKR